MKKQFIVISTLSLFCFLNSALAHPPSTLSIRFIGAAIHVAGVTNVNLVKSDIETLPTGNGSFDQFLVLTSDQQARCVISKAAAAKQGVTIEMLNDLANHYQVEVSCVYSSTSQTASDNFGFRASMR